MKCRKCGNELTSLDVYTLEENKQTVNLVDEEDNPTLDYGVKEPVENSAVKTKFECPFCRELLLSVVGDGDDQKTVKLLSKIALCRRQKL